ncbi:tetratricopeptide repeat protein [Streptomyces sp. NPDC093510]|uniref:tetratricopeptide repeat protein n=1 Tax=Streptomyces sp. NPDC093510 TaxID=3155199 RepID=UPI0034422C66
MPNLFEDLRRIGDLKRGRMSGRPSDNSLAKHAKVSRDTVGAWLRGDRFPHRDDEFLMILKDIRDWADRQGILDLPAGNETTETVAELLAEDRWQKALTGERKRRAEASSAATVRQQAQAGLLSGGTGRATADTVRPDHRQRDETGNSIGGGSLLGPVVQAWHGTVQLPVSVPPALSGLPAPSATFTGRSQHVRELLADLAPDACGRHSAARVTLVTGMAGVGKTELAVHTAARALREAGFPGGVLFIDLFGYDRKRALAPERALDSLLRALGMGEHIPTDLHDRVRQYRSVLAAYAEQDRRILLVLDNASTAEQVTPLLPTDGVSAALITSRHILGIEARLHDLNVLGEKDSIDLLRRALTTARAEADTRIAHAPADAAAIAHLCAGLPLALRICAALLATAPRRPLVSVAQALTAAHTRLERLGARKGDHPVRAAFDLSYLQLNEQPHAARMFRLLSLAPGPDISSEIAAHLAAVDLYEAEELLRGLAAAHLVEYGDSWGRWRLHDLMRLYAAERVVVDPVAKLQRRLLQHYLERARCASSYILELPASRSQGFTDRDQAVAWLEAERSNLVAAVQLAETNGHLDIARDLPKALENWFEGGSQEGIATARVAVRAAHQAGDENGEGQALIQLSHVLREGDAVKEAISAAQKAIELARRLSDGKSIEGRGRRALADALGRGDNQTQAVGEYRHAVRLLREAGDVHVAGTALLNLGVMLYGAGRTSEAIEALRDAVSELSHTSRSVESLALRNLGVALRAAGQGEAAAECYRRAIRLSHEAGGHWDRSNEGAALACLGLLLKDQHQHASAIQKLQQAVTVFSCLEASPSKAHASFALGIFLMEWGCSEEAVTALTSAAEIFHEIGDLGQEERAQRAAEAAHLSCRGKELPGEKPSGR